MSSRKISSVCAGLAGAAALLAFPLGAGAASFANQGAITIGAGAVANTYPSTINVQGVTGQITRPRVTLFGVGGSGTSRLQVLLVGPGGESVVLMRNACGDDANGYTLTFDDAAAASLPAGSCSGQSGSFKPTDYQPNDNAFTAPAPGLPYGTTLSVFNNILPNGAWRLFIEDDVIGGIDAHTIGGGWSLDLDTSSPGGGGRDQGSGKKKKCVKRKGKKGKGGAKKKCRKGGKKK